MLFLSDRVRAFARLGEAISAYINRSGEPALLAFFDQVVAQSTHLNPWFTRDNVLNAMRGISQLLNTEALQHWVSNYHIPTMPKPATIAVIMAGNIPLVGFHDFLSVLMSGHIFLGKPSSADQVLLPALASKLCEIEPGFEAHIRFEMGQLRNFDAVIATGSNNSARYFDYYFGKYPHIIRANRSSVAVLNGNETEQDFRRLYDDICMFFGLGCRNVSKVYLPENHPPALLMEALHDFSNIADHTKYFNNYEYNKALFLINQTPHYDNGFLLLKKDQAFASPVSVLHFEHYNDANNLEAELRFNSEQLQCIVSKDAFFNDSVPFGQAQFPKLTDYADGIDTMRFLMELA